MNAALLGVHAMRLNHAFVKISRGVRFSSMSAIGI